MMTLTLAEAATLTGGTLHGEDGAFRGLCTDSRDVLRGSLFCAISGPSFDGNDFVDVALAAGAAGAICTRIDGPAPSLPGRIRVGDTLAAMATLATEWRGRFALPCAGITGSNGKTTVKEMLASIAAATGPVLATRGNLNNEIGVPLTLARLDDTHRHAVIEMGANHAGEIARLAAMSAPGVGVITQIAPAHLEGFGSVEGVARAKGELFQALPADGVAIAPSDCAHDALWRMLTAHCTLVRFGDDAAADVRVTRRTTGEGEAITLHTPDGVLELLLPLFGAHNARNAAAATAAAQALGIPDTAIVAGLSSMRPVPGRLAPRAGRDGIRLLDDTYNANPASLRAALAVLRVRPGPRWLVLGDMAELGDEGEQLHREAGRMAREAGVERLLCTGTLSTATAQAFGDGARHLPDVDALVVALDGAIPEGATVLVKGSRSAAMERVVGALLDREVAACC